MVYFGITLPSKFCPKPSQSLIEFSIVVYKWYLREIDCT